MIKQFPACSVLEEGEKGRNANSYRQSSVQLDFPHSLWLSRKCEVSPKDYLRNLHNRLTALQNRKRSHTLAKNLQPTAPVHCPINRGSLNVYKNHISNEKKKTQQKNPTQENPKTFAYPAMPEDTTRPYTAEGFTFPSNRHSHYPLTTATGQRYPARSHHPTQPSHQILSWWCQPSPTGRGDGETESRNTQIAKKRIDVSLQLFRCSRRKRKDRKSVV